MLSVKSVVIYSAGNTREIRSQCQEELLYSDDLTLVSETLEGLKGRLESWKEALESKG